MEGIIQLAIGMIFVYSLLSILVTTINTVISSVFHWRAQHLKSALEALITDPEIQSQFLSHPLINLTQTESAIPTFSKTLYPILMKIPILNRLITAVRTGMTHAEPSPAQAQSAPPPAGDVNPVSQIDPQIFGQVMRSILAEKAAIEVYSGVETSIKSIADAATRQHLLQVLAELTRKATFDLSPLWTEAQHSPALTDAEKASLQQALAAVESKKWAGSLPANGSQLLSVLGGFSQINDANFAKALNAVVGTAQSIDDVQSNLENWFNQRMSQLTDTYKRHVTIFTLGVGLAVALIANADLLQIGVAFWNDPILRQAVATTAQTAVNSDQLAQAIQQVQSAQAQAQAQAAATEPAPSSTQEPVSSGSAQVISASAQQLATSLNQLSNLNLPLGWEFTPVTRVCSNDNGDTVDCATAPPDGTALKVACYDPNHMLTDCYSARNVWLALPGNNSNWLGFIISKIVGLAVTILAIGQGAPFWFDLIRRLVSPGASSAPAPSSSG